MTIASDDEHLYWNLWLQFIIRFTFINHHVNVMSPGRYLNDLDCEQQYQGLGVAPLPLHGQVRPIKVEQQEATEATHQWTQQQPHDENHPSNLSSTPPILRRRGRKRDAEDDKLDQVNIFISSFIKTNVLKTQPQGLEISWLRDRKQMS